jgi:hypothetical protein
MLERFLYCLIGSLLAVLTLIYLTVANTVGTTTNAYSVLCADLIIGVLVFCLLCFLYVLPLVFIRAVNEQSLPADDATAVVKFSHESERWQPTTVAHLEDLKQQLWKIEERSRYLHTSELQVRRFSKEDPGAVALWLLERGLSILRKQCWKETGEAQGLRLAIERIYAGDVDHEVRDYQERIAELYAERANNTGDPESWLVQSTNKSIDKKIRQCQRQIAELEQWRKKVTAATALPAAAESPNEIAWRNFMADMKRTATVPIAQAISRVEAAMAGVEAKRHYERMVDEQQRRGTITPEEADYIRQKINVEFLTDSLSIYA